MDESCVIIIIIIIAKKFKRDGDEPFFAALGSRCLPYPASWQ
jgi:hypothetical protein